MNFYVFKARKFLFVLLAVTMVFFSFLILRAGFRDTSGLISISREEPADTQDQRPWDEDYSELDRAATLVAVAPIPAQFSEYRLEREQSRSAHLHRLEELLADASLSESRREEVQTTLVQTLNASSREIELENILKAQGFVDVIAVVDSTSVVIVVPETITREIAGNIGELVKRVTGIRLDQIIIIDQPLI